MESPISRSASAVFSPGSHRRSHPNLQHLSFAPLTPKYPIGPADYDQYFDPATSQLHTSASLSNIATLPSPGGILTSPPNRSRANSKTRLRRKAKSHVTIQSAASTSAAAAGEEEPAIVGSGKKARRPPSKLKLDATWLVQTGLALTEGSRESKGQLWIAKRDSSTSLHNLELEGRSKVTTPNRSRRPSRSRRHLAMTPANELKLATTQTEYQAQWTDPQTQAEIAAETERELAEELHEESSDEDEDRYGAMGFDEHFNQVELDFDEQDEKEVREVVRQGFGVGKWMDGLFDALSKIEDEPDIEAQSRAAGVDARVAKIKAPPESNSVSDVSVEAPPESTGGVWDDARWFGRLIARTIGS